LFNPRGDGSRSPQVVDDDVDEPGAKSAAILLLFVLHLLLLRGDGWLVTYT
jgi:hypothetical protein